jgi:MFS family permease
VIYHLIFGGFSFSGFLLALLVGFCLIPIQGRSILSLQALFLIAAISGTLFLLHYQRNRSTVLDANLIGNRDFSFALASSFLVWVLYAGNNFLFPLFLTYRRQIDPYNAGLIIMGSAIFPIVFGPLAGRLADRYSCRPVCMAATLVMFAMSLAFSMLKTASDVLPMIFSVCLFRAGIASFLGFNRKLILGHCPMGSKGSGSGIMMMINYSGLAMGVAVFETIFIEAAIFGGLARDGTQFCLVLRQLYPYWGTMPVSYSRRRLQSWHSF